MWGFYEVDVFHDRLPRAGVGWDGTGMGRKEKGVRSWMEALSHFGMVHTVTLFGHTHALGFWLVMGFWMAFLACTAATARLGRARCVGIV